jgi:hypothetical protein
MSFSSGGINSNGICPIGGIIAWAKTLTGVPNLPFGYVQCDGQTLSDSNSLLNGQVITDLNGNNYFLRGNSTSGGTGGASSVTLTGAQTGLSVHSHNISDPTHNHAYTHGDTLTRLSGATSTGGIGTQTTGSNTTGVTIGNTGAVDAISAHENQPAYYDVVWIMRVK